MYVTQSAREFTIIGNNSGRNFFHLAWRTDSTRILIHDC